MASGDLQEEVSRLKQKSGGYILVHGGSRFTQSLDRLGLIDEYRLNLKLVDCTKFGTGAVALTYQPA